MIPGYISTYKMLEISCRNDVDKQIELYAKEDPNYNVNEFRKALKVYKASKSLKQLVSDFNLRQHLKSVKQSAVK